MDPAVTERLSEDEYIARERAADRRSEYCDGVTFAMAGGSVRHNLVAANLTAAIRVRLRGKPCVALTSDQRILVNETGLYTYPDLTIVCGGVQVHPRFDDTIVPSAEAYDRGAKFAHYRRIESLEEVLLVATDEPFVEHYTRVRDDADDWVLHTRAGRGVVLRVESADFDLPLDELYEGLEQLPPEIAAAKRLPRPKAG